MEINNQNSWFHILESEFTKPYFINLQQFLVEEYSNNVVYPPKDKIYYAFELTPYEDVKVVILGQDPYHGRNQAHGLSFSVQSGTDVPPSLVNVFKELHSDLGCEPVNHGCLESWARQGVLLLNTILTVRQGEPKSHADKGWEIFTDKIIRTLNERDTPVIFILWGYHARSKCHLIDSWKHTIITGPHPAASIYSDNMDFFGSKPFSRANQALEERGMTPINWQLPANV
ncbi:uracil-DNA glycosylase-like [Amyelois transitella]|uniref:uracil-DNA glycosylase-like n=1 Tax=Amyelois transitella TaxID=680683 RepID=UPI00298F8C66|nr:uracil-DNA glycosylase-like [Amyelois transitella]